MARNLNRMVDTMTYDGLISGLTPEAKVKGITIKKLNTAATLVRGTVLAKSQTDGKAYILGTNPAGIITEDYSGDGSTTTFTITASPLPLRVKSAKVGDNDATISSYNAQTGVVTLSTAPASGTNNVHITYDNPSPDIPDSILADDIEVGTSADVNAAVYVMGCFDPAKLTVKSGYTITDADKDILRERGIYLAVKSAN